MNKLKTLCLGFMCSVGALMAADTPAIPTDPLKADYAVFDYVFAGVIAFTLIFAVARRAKGFIR